MKLGIMQPYIFPYIGYFQLINAVDKFVVYDDVDFIKQGWINRNKILLNGKAFLFTIPVMDASSSRLIKDTGLNENEFKRWKNKFYKTMEAAYKKAPHYDTVFALLTDILDKKVKDISELCKNAITGIISYLSIQTAVVPTSVIYKNNHLKSTERVIDICRRENATSYLNAQGGAALYNKNDFSKHNIDLQFIVPGSIVYPQFDNEFVPSLSILDVLMFNSTGSIRDMLNNYKIA